MKRVLRKADTGDAITLVEINKAASRHPWAGSQFNFNDECVLLIECEGAARGFIVFSQVLDVATILNIAVHPDYRRRGIASELLTAALASAIEGGVNRCLLEVRLSNTGASALYESFGFQIDAMRKNYYPAENGREDAILMSKNLLSTTQSEDCS